MRRAVLFLVLAPPRSLAECRGTWNPGGTPVERWWNLTSGLPRTTPEPIWAETPKLPAVGEKNGRHPRLQQRALKAGRTPKLVVVLLAFFEEPSQKGYPQQLTHPNNSLKRERTPFVWLDWVYIKGKLPGAGRASL